jgi:Flp pilus assembly protein TadD
VKTVSKHQLFGIGILVLGVTAADAAGVPSTVVMPAALGDRDPIREFSDGIINLQAKQYSDAAASLEKAAADDPQDSEVWRFLGAARAGTHDWTGSKAAYEQALQLDPDDPGAHAGLGLALAALRDPKAQAELDWLKAKSKDCAGRCADATTLATMLNQVQGALNGSPQGPVL